MVAQFIYRTAFTASLQEHAGHKSLVGTPKNFAHSRVLEPITRSAIRYTCGNNSLARSLTFLSKLSHSLIHRCYKQIDGRMCTKKWCRASRAALSLLMVRVAAERNVNCTSQLPRYTNLVTKHGLSTAYQLNKCTAKEPPHIWTSLKTPLEYLISLCINCDFTIA